MRQPLANFKESIDIAYTFISKSYCVISIAT